MRHRETHLLERVGWLRAAVLGANDGLVSTASLVMGVASAAAGRSEILLAGVAGLVAGALSMAAGEYVSVSSQRDTEQADREKEAREQREQPEAELQELAGIYQARGLGPELAQQVATELMRVDPLGAHLRDELGLVEELQARPWQAALVSAGSFALGALPPLALVWLVDASARLVAIPAAALLLLAVLGALGARLGGAPLGRAALRVTLGGGIAMGVTALIGGLVGLAV
jgi:VIT1/CCC1 family predicted Fe2+/Mn2+ transporter